MGLRDRIVHEEEVDTEGSWAISYGDMITLLLAFFVLFFSFDKEKKRVEGMSKALVAQLQILEQSSKDGNENKLNFGDSDAENIDKSVVEKWGAKVYQVGQRIIVDFPHTSFFDLGSISVNSLGRSVIEQFVQLYTPYAGNYVLAVRAYTDSRKVRATASKQYTDNLELSALRSVSTMKVLQKQGIPLEKMRLGGFGVLELDEEKQKKSLKKFQDKEATARKVVFVIEPQIEVDK